MESFHCLTSPPSKARMKAQLSLVQERTVSVLPSLNRRVIDDSYVRPNPFWSCNQKIKIKCECEADKGNRIRFSLTTGCLSEHAGTNCINSQFVGLQGRDYPVEGQLECNLNEGIWVDSTFLDLCFAKVSEDNNVHVHIISEGLGHRQGLADLLLTLREKHYC